MLTNKPYPCWLKFEYVETEGILDYPKLVIEMHLSPRKNIIKPNIGKTKIAESTTNSVGFTDVDKFYIGYTW